MDEVTGLGLWTESSEDGPRTECTVAKCVSPPSRDSWVLWTVVPFMTFDVHRWVPATMLRTDGSLSSELNVWVGWA